MISELTLTFSSNFNVQTSILGFRFLAFEFLFLAKVIFVMSSLSPCPLIENELIYIFKKPGKPGPCHLSPGKLSQPSIDFDLLELTFRASMRLSSNALRLSHSYHQPVPCLCSVEGPLLDVGRGIKIYFKVSPLGLYKVGKEMSLRSDQMVMKQKRGLLVISGLSVSQRELPSQQLSEVSSHITSVFLMRETFQGPEFCRQWS